MSQKVGGPRKLREYTYTARWPSHGVYFFFEEGEDRSTSGQGMRVVRVGTHAIKRDSKTMLWDRLANHRGHVKGPGGNHWNSIFRHHVGTALMNRHPELNCPSWCGEHRDAAQEQRLEEKVSETIRAMPFLWIAVGDHAGGNHLRDYIERNAIALLSNYERSPFDPASGDWLGKCCTSDKVKLSGLWNYNLVTHSKYDANLIDSFGELVEQAA